VDERDDHATTRRRLLQGLAAAGAGALAPTTVGAAASPTKASKGLVVFRFTTRNAHSCRACRQHHRYKVFAAHALADANRAHPGCNCQIVPSRLNSKLYRAFFGDDGVAMEGVGDFRHPGVQQLLAKQRRRRKRRTG